MNKYAQLYIEGFDKIAAGLGFKGMSIVKAVLRDFKGKGGELTRVRPSNPDAVISGVTGIGGAGVSALVPIFDKSNGGSKANRGVIDKIKNTIRNVRDEWL